MTARALLAAVCALALLVHVPAAAAANPAERTVANAVVAKAAGNSIGELSFRATFDDATATATAAPGPLRLPAGAYLIQTCVSAKAAGAAPAATCERAEARPNVITGLGSVTAPAARLTVDRPAAGQPPTTIAGRVVVFVIQTGGSALYAASWPAGGLPSAAIAVPAVGELTAGLVLGPQGPATPGIEAGGINTGSQDSVCFENQLPGATPLQGSTSALGALPFEYEVDEPAGGTPPRGVMLIVHGGAWSIVGRASMNGMRPDVERWRARGWRTVNTTYRPCGPSIGDIVALYDRVRSTYGRSLPICVFGRSAGGHLSLLLAAIRPEVACVISIAGPSDLAAIADQPTPADPVGARKTANFATAAFGGDRLAEISPTRLPVPARVLYGIGVGDVLVPWEQATNFAAAQRRRDRASYVDTMHVEAGDVRFEHAGVSQAGLDAFFAREQTLVAPLIIGSVTAPAAVRLKAARSGGLRVPFTCARRCTVTARLELGAGAARRAGLARIVGRGSARRASRGRGTLIVQVTRRARAKLRPATAQLVSDIAAGGTHRRQKAAVRLRP